MTLPCFCCGKQLESAVHDSTMVYNQPSEGAAFISHGGYGCTVFDPIGRSGRHLELNICDECLLRNKERVLHVVPLHETRYDVQPWNPDQH